MSQMISGNSDQYLGALIAAGDLDGNGADDLVAGAAPDDEEEIDSGAVLVFLDPVGGTFIAADADSALRGEATGDGADNGVAGPT